MHLKTHRQGWRSMHAESSFIFITKYLESRPRFQLKVNSLHLNALLYFLSFSVCRKTLKQLYGNCFSNMVYKMQIDIMNPLNDVMSCSLSYGDVTM